MGERIFHKVGDAAEKFHHLGPAKQSSLADGTRSLPALLDLVGHPRFQGPSRLSTVFSLWASLVASCVGVVQFHQAALQKNPKRWTFCFPVDRRFFFLFLSPSQIRQRVHQILNMRGSSIKIVRHIIKGESLRPWLEGSLEAPRLMFSREPWLKFPQQALPVLWGDPVVRQSHR